MLERWRIHLHSHVVGAGAFCVGVRNCNNLCGADSVTGNIANLNGVTNAQFGKTLRYFEINPPSRADAGEGGQHFAKAHEITKPLRVNAKGARKRCVHGHAAESRIQHGDLRSE